jgi:hypothetical protein
MTQNNLGTALRTLGERESGTERLEEAVSVIELAHSIYREADMLQYEAYFQSKLETLRELIRTRKTH